MPCAHKEITLEISAIEGRFYEGRFYGSPRAFCKACGQKIAVERQPAQCYRIEVFTLNTRSPEDNTTQAVGGRGGQSREVVSTASQKVALDRFEYTGRRGRPRIISTRPWEVDGVSRSTWERNRRKPKGK